AGWRRVGTVRELGVEGLEAEGELSEAQMALAGWCHALISEAESAIQGTDQARWFGVFEAEHDNVRAAIGWAIDRGEAEEALRFINGPLWFYWSMRGWTRGEHHWLQRGRGPAERGRERVEPSVLAKAHFTDGLFYLQTGDYDQARSRFETSFTLYRTLGDQYLPNVAVVLTNLATTENDQGNYARARSRFEEVLT